MVDVPDIDISTFDMSNMPDISNFKFSIDTQLLARIFVLPSVIACFATGGVYVLMKKRLRYLDNAKKLHNIIIKNKLYDDKYFPEVYFQEDENKMLISIKLDGGKYHDKLLDLGARLEQIYTCELQSKVIKNGYLIYTLIKSSANKRINFEGSNEVEDKFKIPLQKDLTWNIISVPHLILSAPTGSGKTFLLFYLIKEFLKRKFEVKIFDPKAADLSMLSFILGEDNCCHDKLKILEQLRNAVAEMDRRYELMRNPENFKFGQVFKDYGLTARVLVFDEFISFIESLGRDDEKEAKELLNLLSLKARQAGIFLVLASQRIDCKWLDGAFRDQFGIRISLGCCSPSAYKMIFPNADKYFTDRTEMASGFIYVAGTNIIQEFYGPLANKQYDFFEDIKKIVAQNKEEKIINPQRIM